MREHGIDYFENSRRATLAQHAYAIANPMRLARLRRRALGAHRLRRPDRRDARDRRPTRAVPHLLGARRIVHRRQRRRNDRRRRAAAARSPFAPEIVIPTLVSMRDDVRRARLRDATASSTRSIRRSRSPCRCSTAASMPSAGWFDTDYLGHRSGPDRRDDRELPQRARVELMRRNPHVVRGLRAAGFTRRLARHGASRADERRASRGASSSCSPRRMLVLLVAARVREPTTHPLLGDGARGRSRAGARARFERENPGVRVHVQQIPWTAAHEKLLTALRRALDARLAQLGNTWIAGVRRRLRALEPLDARARRSASGAVPDSGYFAGIWDTNVIDGAALRRPWYVDTRVLFYRKDILARAGYDSMPANLGRVARRRWQAMKRAVGAGPLCRSSCRSTSGRCR